MTGMPPGTARQARLRSWARRHPAGGIPAQLTDSALRLLIGASVYREPAGPNALLFQIGQADTAGAPGSGGSGSVWRGSDVPGPGRRALGPSPPFRSPGDVHGLSAKCEASGLLGTHRLAA